MFKLNFLHLRTRALLKKNKTNRGSVPYTQAQVVGIVFTVEDRKKHEEVKEFAKHMEKDGKTVRVLEFLPTGKENYDFLYSFFTEKQINFWGAIQSPEVQRFCEQRFDYLFHLDNENSPVFQYLLARSKAHCRVGKFREHENAFYELMIDSKGSYKELFASIYNYTKQLR
jgi:hypothetical protein